MSRLREPTFEARHRAELAAELIARARAWLPDWRPSDAGDFGTALLQIVARLEATVTERMAKVPAKTYRGFLAWLGVHGLPARAARLPVVFSMAPGSAPVLAAPPIQLQATPVPLSASDAVAPITFETDAPLKIVPGSLTSIVGVDAASDAYYVPPPGFSALAAPEVGPSVWELTTDASGGATELQLQPEQGLDALPILTAANGLEYRVTAAKAGLVTIDPPLGTPEPQPDAPPDPSSLPGLDEGQPLRAVTEFDPFGGHVRNSQTHALYIGSESLLNLPTRATIRISGVNIGDDGGAWSYWGKAGTADPVGWQPVTATFSKGGLDIGKGPGSVEILEIGGRKSRWLRASKVKSAAPTTVSGLTMSVNCNAAPRCPRAPDDPKSTVAVEAMANTAPLVLDTPFYPLGREPRLFDTFYLGCAEAFSKPGAAASICFQAPNGATAALVAASVGTGGPPMFFGIGVDGNLHRFGAQAGNAAALAHLQPVHPPFSENGAMAVSAPSMMLNVNQPARLTTVTRAQDVLVAVTAGPEAWLWSQSPDPAKSRWFRLGPIIDSSATSPAPPLDSAHPPEVVVVSDGAGLHLYGLVKGVLLETSLDANWDGRARPKWTRVGAVAPGNRHWRHIAPVFFGGAAASGARFEDGLVAVDASGVALYDPGARGSKWSAIDALGAVETDGLPLAVKRTNGAVLIVAQKTNDRVAAWSSDLQKPIVVPSKTVSHSFDWTPSTRDEVAIVFARELEGGARQLCTWFPMAAASGPIENDTTYTAPANSGINSSPAVASTGAVASGTNGEILLTPFDAARLLAGTLTRTRLDDVLIARHDAVHLAKDDFFAVTHGLHTRVFRVAEAPTPLDADTVMYVPAHGKLQSIDGPVAMFARRIAAGVDGSAAGPDAIVPTAPDADAAVDETIVVTFAVAPSRPSVHHVVSKVPLAGPATKLTVAPDLPHTGALSYVHVKDAASEQATAHPRIDLAGQPASIVNALKMNDVYFRGAKPARQAALRLLPDSQAPTHALLAEAWTTPPKTAAGMRAFAVNAMYSALITLGDPLPASPALSWEYWDGTAWWKIRGLTDGTASLLQTGVVSFCVPANLQQTDVAGRKNFWIRARLVGGDYGQATITVTSTTSGTTTTQTVDRSLASVKPPLMSSVAVSYSVCCPTRPDFVITQDAGAFRDQTAVNTTPGATVEYFTPLDETIRRATGSLPTGTAAAAGASGRALYLGFDFGGASIDGGPISLLFLAADTDDIGAYPLQIDALRETRFDPIPAVADGTRGLSESGVVSFALGSALPETALFGQGRQWIRVRPNPDATRPWVPRLQGVYVNATYATAQETQRLERLGSSDGSPGQTVSLARPPVLEGTLELRVLEPLEEEEAATLSIGDSTRVITSLGGRDGLWVRWTEVDDTDDEGADARVYSLDPDSGLIKFGDGRHGRIPPIGRDSIVAAVYKRGGGEAANRVGAWAQVSLLTPIPGVQAVSAPDGAAGGSDPQTADEALRFAPDNLFMRQRALTLSDFEQLASQFSREVAQARAIRTGGTVRLVVAMRGPDPLPSNAVRRAMRLYLAALAAPDQTSDAALAIAGPLLVPLRLSLELAIDDVSASGSVADGVTSQIAALLDPATGGLDRRGWPLGQVPGEVDIAAALDGIPHLEEVLSIGRQTVDADDQVTALPATIGADALVVFAPDGLTIKWAIEVVA